MGFNVMGSEREARVSLTTDYLVIGAGASGMAFIDEILHGSKDNKIILVDTRAQAGGHWIDAYDFVSLHMPAGNYGVRSTALGTSVDDLSNKAQLLAYYGQLLKDFIASGRVQFYPMCKYQGNGTFVSMVEKDLHYAVTVRRKIVDTTILERTIPSTSPTPFELVGDVHLVPINSLCRLEKPWARYVIIGGGKTGTDAVLHLLKQNVAPARIVWVVPNDMWFVQRYTMRDQVRFMDKMEEHVLAAKNVADLHRRLEAAKIYHRLDKTVEPTKQRTSTITEAEVARLQKVKNVVRLGRIARIETNRIVFVGGEEIPTHPDTLHVNCTARDLQATHQAVFAGNTINIMSVHFPIYFSAGIIAALELKFPDDEEKKNSVFTALKSSCPLRPVDFLARISVVKDNERRLRECLGVEWFRGNRLSDLYHLTEEEYEQSRRGSGTRQQDVMDKLKALVEEGRKETAGEKCCSFARKFSTTEAMACNILTR